MAKFADLKNQNSRKLILWNQQFQRLKLQIMNYSNTLKKLTQIIQLDRREVTNSADLQVQISNPTEFNFAESAIVKFYIMN